MKGKMKAQVFYEPFKMELEEIDIPEIGAGDVLVKVKAVGICGSDISYYFGHSPLNTPDGKGPLILGHEFSGVVAELGADAEKMGILKVGDKVIINPVEPCLACPSCMRAQYNVCENVGLYGVGPKDGAFAEYARVPAINVFKMPDGVSFEAGALAEPIACSNFSVNKLDIKLGNTVVVFGCGAIGLIDIQVVRAAGAGIVIGVDVADYNLEKAKELGADFVFNTGDKNSKYYTDNLVESIKASNRGRLVPRAIVPTNAMPALQQALEVTGTGATIVYFGLPSPEDILKVPVLDFIQSDKTIRASWLQPLVWDNVFDEIAAGQVVVEPLITNRFPLEQTKEGIIFMKESKENKVKGLILVD